MCCNPKCWKILALLPCLAVSVLQESVAAAEQWIPIYDARSNKAEAKISKSDIQLVKKNVYSRALKYWGHEPSFSVQDWACGSFTSRSSSEKAFLYRICDNGHNFANNGIAIFQDRKLVAHYGYDGGWEYGIVALPDINGDGLHDVLIEGGFTNMAENQGGIFLFTLRPKHPSGFGCITVEHSLLGLPDEKSNRTARRVFVKPSTKPSFSTENYKFVKGKWQINRQAVSNENR